MVTGLHLMQVPILPQFSCYRLPMPLLPLLNAPVSGVLEPEWVRGQLASKNFCVGKEFKYNTEWVG